MLNSGVFKSDFFKVFKSYAFYSILSSAIGFLSVPYLTRVLTPEEFGILGIFQVLLYIAVPLISLQSTALVGINLVQLEGNKYQEFLGQFISFGFIVFFVIFFSGFLCSLFYPLWIMLLIAIPLIAIIRFLTDIKKVELVQNSKATYYGRYSLAVSFFSLVVTILFVSGADWGWEGRIAATLTVETVLLMWFILRVDRSWIGMNFKISKEFTIEILKYGLPLLVAVGAGWLINQADRLIVLRYFTLADVGVYTAAYMIGFSINIINATLVNSVAPKVYRGLHNGTGLLLVRRYQIWYSFFIISLGMVLGAVSYFWIDVLLGEAYSNAGSIVAVVAIAFGFSGAYRVPGLVLEFYKMNVLKAKLLYLCAFSNIAVSIGLIPYFGILAPAIGTLIAYLLLSILVYHFAMQAMRERGNDA